MIQQSYCNCASHVPLCVHGQVNNDGSVTFTSPATYQETTTTSGTTPAVCGFCGDIDIRKSGTVWYGITTSLIERENIAKEVKVFEDFPQDYLPSWVLVVTWDGVASFVDNNGLVSLWLFLILPTVKLAYIPLYKYHGPRVTVALNCLLLAAWV